MASRHRKQNRNPAKWAFTTSMASAAVTIAALSGAFAAHVTDGSAMPARELVPAPAAQQPLSQEGRLVAVTPTSVTAQSVNGFARTYVINSQTNAITLSGSSVGGAATTFAVNDEVAIVGVVRDGTAVATAVAAQQVANLDGPPMDGV